MKKNRNTKKEKSHMRMRQKIMIRKKIKKERARRYNREEVRQLERRLRRKNNKNIFIITFLLL
jgi:hypothetical protein